MTRPINGVLFVESFNPTGVPGEYTFENATFNNQADATGSGALDVLEGFVLYIQATDPNTFTTITGVVHRYKLTTVSPVDSSTLSGTMLWDEEGDEQDVPTNGAFSIIAETTALKHLGLPALDTSYADLTAGISLAAVLVDVKNIVDKIVSGAGGGASRKGERLTVDSDGQTNFSLSETPIELSAVNFTVNGLRYIIGEDADFTITGNTLTWTDVSFTLSVGDALYIDYSYTA